MGEAITIHRMFTNSLLRSSKNSLFNLNKSFMSTSTYKRYFMVRYTYTEDGYYIRLGDIRKKHETHIQSLKESAETKIIETHFFPFEGKLMLIETLNKPET